LSDAVLIFDEINAKGFEGDILLNGLSEFLRNLLICKDERAAHLLKVVDDFKQKYIETAKDSDTAWLISALNLLSESEINYKAARNKRLHVELALIKLAYLSQALHLSNITSDKKKGTEAVKPVAFRRIPPLEIKSKKTGVSGDVGKIKKADTLVESNIPVSVKAPTLIIEYSKNTSSATTTSLGALSKIRQEVVNRKTQTGAADALGLEAESLTEAWCLFTAELKKNKNSAAQSFEGAEIRILDELRFEILTNNNLEQRFIEHEKRKLSDLLQLRFRNKSISFSVIVREQNGLVAQQEKTLSKRDQFFKIAEMYPLVKELKDKLKLELDY
jgi:DNA polymerase-3 subunit gamma/tau